MTFKTGLMTAAAMLVAFAPAFAETETVVTKEVSLGAGGGTTTTTTRYYYNDVDANNNGILDTQEFPGYVYTRWDNDGDGFISDAEWQSNTARWYPKGYSEYKTYTYWDKDGDGRLDSNEFGTVISTTNLYNTWDVNADKTIEGDEYAKSTFRIYDTNDDGSLSMKEWMDSQ